ncbi:MAG: exo-beta-N-acetylmuramidase NamZ domain-containing protein [Blastocatellia bacterium]
MNKITLGIEVLLRDRLQLLSGARTGLICHPASIDHDFRHSADLLGKDSTVNLTTLFGPQHGIRGETQDNMIEWEGFRDARTGVMAYSLYGEVRKPTAQMLSEVDVIVFDVQDVGTRVYTFIYTMALAMQSAKELGKRFVVCDRPNPIGGVGIEGSILESGQESFVGMYPIPMRHGMTVGELARMFNEEFGIGCDLEVIPMQGYKREFWFDDTDARWVLPSPNIPVLETAVVYPGMVLVEGVKFSEGRGTTRPFEITGAPYADAYELAEHLNNHNLSGVHFRPHSFKPTFQKHVAQLCHGVQLHVTDREAFKPVISCVAVIKAMRDLWPEGCKWQTPPYEYVYDRLPFDVIAGTTKLREQIEGGVSLEEIAASWQAGEKDFAERRRPYLLY